MADYAARLKVDYTEKLDRLTTFFRLIWIIPIAIIFALVTLSALRFGRQLRELKISPVWLAVLLLFGSIGGATGLSIVLPISILAANIPQVWVAYREKKNLEGLSLGTWLLSIAEGLLWGSYGLVQQDISVLVNNTFQVTTSAIIVAFKLAHMARQAKQSEIAGHRA